MRRKPRGRAVHGWLVFDKPLGMSSSHAVAVVRRRLDAAKAGHGGTLDPLATGVLPIALGEATKTAGFAMNGRKLYRFTLRWGEERGTDDREGEIVAQSAARPSREEVLGALPRFLGTTLQRPPDFSAIKIAGARAYDLARAGVAPPLAPRPVEIFGLRLIDSPDRDHAEFEAEVGKGAYVRALARDLGRLLGCYAHVTALRRLAVGCFTLDAAISLDKLESLGHSPDVSGLLRPIETVLDDIPALAVTGQEAAAIRHGRPVKVLRAGDSGTRAARAGVPSSQLSDGTVVCAMEGTTLVALARYHAGEIRPVRVLNL